MGWETREDNKTESNSRRRRKKGLPLPFQRMGGRWIKTLSSVLYNNNHRHILTPPSSPSLSKPHFPFFINRFLTVAAIPCHIDPDPIDLDHTRGFGAPEDDPCVKIPIKAFFLSTRFWFVLYNFSNHQLVFLLFLLFDSVTVPLLLCQFQFCPIVCFVCCCLFVGFWRL